MRYFERFIGFRYLLSKRKKSVWSLTTFITLGGIMLGVMSLIVVTSVMNGFSKDIQTKVLNFKNHILIQSPDLLPFYCSSETVEVLKSADSRILDVHPFLSTEMIAKHNAQFSGVVVKGIDVTLFEKLKKDKEQRGILMGKELAVQLYVGEGDAIEIISPVETTGPLGIMPRKKQYRIAQFFETGLYDVDAKYIYLPLSEAQDFLNYDRKIDGIEINISEVEAVQTVILNLQKLPEMKSLEIRGWPELNKNLFGALKLEKLAMFIILSFIILVAALNIITTITRVVLDKQREISILKAMGARRKQILSIFLLQGMVTAVVGIFLGAVGGFLICEVMRRQAFIQLPDIFYSTAIPVDMRLSQFVIIGVTAILITGLCSFYPAWKASEMDPLDGIRY